MLELAKTRPDPEKKGTQKIYRAKAREVRLYFILFNDPKFKLEQARCRYCHQTMRHAVNKMENHPSTCQQLPKEVTRPPPRTSSWTLQVKKSTPRAQGAIEIRKHFLFFRDGRFKGLRAQCIFCRKEMGDDLQIIQRHLATCQQLPPHVHRPSPRDRRCPLCFQLIKIDRLDVHIERCEGRKRCRWCLGAFKDAVISMHTEECKKSFASAENARSREYLSRHWKLILKPVHSSAVIDATRPCLLWTGRSIPRHVNCDVAAGAEKPRFSISLSTAGCVNLRTVRNVTSDGLPTLMVIT